MSHFFLACKPCLSSVFTGERSCWISEYSANLTTFRCFSFGSDCRSALLICFHLLQAQGIQYKMRNSGLDMKTPLQHHSFLTLLLYSLIFVEAVLCRFPDLISLAAALPLLNRLPRWMNYSTFSSGFPFRIRGFIRSC